MRGLILLYLFGAFCVASYAKHVHPRSVIMLEEDTNMDSGDTAGVDEIPIETIRNIKPSRFVPVNNILFFKRYSPCEEGFERDLLGVCREVWD